MAEVLVGPGRPDEYRLSCGRVVPSVTEILGRAKHAPRLLQWAARMGPRGLRERDAAARVGDLAHGAWLRDRWEPMSKLEAADVELAVELLDGWEHDAGLERMIVEHPFVSEEHEYGGTVDVVFRDVQGTFFEPGTVFPADLKAGREVYAEHVAQLSGYSGLLEEHGRGRLSAGVVFRLHREKGRLVEAPVVVTRSSAEVAARYEKREAFHEIRLVNRRQILAGWSYFQMALGLVLADAELDAALQDLVPALEASVGKAAE